MPITSAPPFSTVLRQTKNHPPIDVILSIDGSIFGGGGGVYTSALTHASTDDCLETAS